MFCSVKWTVLFLLATRFLQHLCHNSQSALSAESPQSYPIYVRALNIKSWWWCPLKDFCGDTKAAYYFVLFFADICGNLNENHAANDSTRRKIGKEQLVTVYQYIELCMVSLKVEAIKSLLLARSDSDKPNLHLLMYLMVSNLVEMRYLLSARGRLRTYSSCRICFDKTRIAFWILLV